MADCGDPVHVKVAVELKNLSGDRTVRLERGKLLVGIGGFRPLERSCRFFCTDEYGPLDLFRNRPLLSGVKNHREVGRRPLARNTEVRWIGRRRISQPAVCNMPLRQLGIQRLQPASPAHIRVRQHTYRQALPALGDTNFPRTGFAVKTVLSGPIPGHFTECATFQAERTNRIFRCGCGPERLRFSAVTCCGAS